MKIILLGYCGIILIGSLLLTLPVAARSMESTNFLDAFFTATSATCVTGLVRFDTYTHWSLFGQIVILLMIQIGGIGFMTVAIWLASLTRMKIGLTTRFIMQSSIAAPQVGGMVRLTKFILIGTVIVEGCGAVLLCFHFCPDLGFLRGLWFSIFHSVSAFCNAGFDLMGYKAQFSSLTASAGNWYVNIIIMLLIIIGGLGFLVWKDVIASRFHFFKMKLHTKIVICMTLVLVFGGAVCIFLFELNGTVFDGKSLSDQAVGSLFQSVTARTAGFNSLDIAKMTPSSQFLIVCLMMIGGSPGSTAGGVKTTTFAVLLLSIAATFRKRKHTEVYGRRLPEGATRMASCVFMSYMFLSLSVSMIISNIEGTDFMSALFESVSAMGTVGLSMSLTPTLGIVSELLLAFLMIIGRVGSITFLLAFSSGKGVIPSKLPAENIQIG